MVVLDDGLAPDQRQAITQRSCEISKFSGYKYTLRPSDIGYLDHCKFLIYFPVLYVIFGIYSLRMR